MENIVYHVHTIELGDRVMIALILILAVIVVCTPYAMQTPGLALDPPKEPMGFHPR
jgi:hypothetical protein